jgi:hypothetical protein
MTKMFESEFDPLGALQAMAKHQEEMSRQFLEMAKAMNHHITVREQMVIHMNNQSNLILELEERIEQLENQ